MVALEAIGLGALTPYLEFVLLPALAVLIVSGLPLRLICSGEKRKL